MVDNKNMATLKLLSNPQQIHDSPFNDSPTKALYSFPNAERFNKGTKQGTCMVAFYDIDPKLYKNSRATSLGKGGKYDFTKNGKGNPGPNAYFPINNTIMSEMKNGKSFGVSRDKITNNGLTQILKNSSLIPGPGTYNPALLKSYQTVSFHIKPESKKSPLSEIGPGSYKINSTFEPNKPIFNSKHQSVKGVKFGNPSKISKNKDENSNYLPPVYDMTYAINVKGNYYNSKYSNSKCRSFGKSTRDSKGKANMTPGPGQYKMPSEFGLYQSSNVND